MRIHSTDLVLLREGTMMFYVASVLRSMDKPD